MTDHRIVSREDARAALEKWNALHTADTSKLSDQEIKDLLNAAFNDIEEIVRTLLEQAGS